MDIGEKIKLVRDKEDLSQKNFSELVDIKTGTLKNVEQGRSDITYKQLRKITNHPRFSKYTMFLMVDDDAAIEDQEAPSANEFGALLEQLSENQIDQTIEYMEFLLSK